MFKRNYDTAQTARRRKAFVARLRKRVFLVVVYRPTARLGDREIEVVVGYARDGSGCELATGKRDMSWSFEDRRKATAAVTRLKKAFGRKARVKIEDGAELAEDFEKRNTK